MIIRQQSHSRYRVKLSHPWVLEWHPMTYDEGVGLKLIVED